MKRLIALAALLALSTGTLANDSSSAIGLGGIELTRNDAISMDSEELFLSAQRVTVKYRFTNTSAENITTLVSFPLPPVPNGIMGYLGDQDYPDWSKLDFTTRIDGQPVTLDIISRTEANGKDVAARLKTLGWPVRYWGHGSEPGQDAGALVQRLAQLSDAEITNYVAEGLLRWQDQGRNDRELRPNWNLVTYINRTQTFPAGKTVNVEHSYKPHLGSSVGGSLERQYRRDHRQYLAAYCADKAFLRAFDKRRYSGRKDAEGNEPDSFYIEYWLDYVLKSGANWRGPIKDFRLVVDKGNAGNLVSFCMDGVRKIGPTQFEVRKTNFEPTKDLNILFVRWAPFD